MKFNFAAALTLPPTSPTSPHAPALPPTYPPPLAHLPCLLCVHHPSCCGSTTCRPSPTLIGMFHLTISRLTALALSTSYHFPTVALHAVSPVAHETQHSVRPPSSASHLELADTCVHPLCFRGAHRAHTSWTGQVPIPSCHRDALASAATLQDTTRRQHR